MSQLVKVTPSMSGERMASAVASAMPGLSGKKSSQGIELMDDEVEEYSCEYKATARVTEGVLVRLSKKIKYYMTCQCICECSIPQQTWAVQVLVTNRRIILRERMACVEPGIKKCCYYTTCLCCCPTNVDSGYEEQFCVDRKDVKDYTFNITHRNVEMKCLCCLISKRVDEGFKVKLFCAKSIGETRQGWQSWTIDKDTKTYSASVEFSGKLSRVEGTQLRQVLHAVAAQNAAAAAQVAVLQREAKLEPVQLTVHL